MENFTGTSEARTGSTALPKRKKTKRESLRRLSNGAMAFLLGCLVGPFFTEGVDRYSTPIWSYVDDFMGGDPLNAKAKIGRLGEGYSSVALYGEKYNSGDLIRGDSALRPQVYIDSGEGVPWEGANVEIVMTANNKDDVLIIDDIRPVIFNYDTTEPAAILQPSVGAGGGPLIRLFTMKLHNGTAHLVDEGIEGVGDEPSSVVPQGALGDTFSLSGDTLAQIVIYIPEADGKYEFGFDIHYSIQGRDEDLVHHVRNDATPFSVAGGEGPEPLLLDEKGYITSF